MEMSVDTGEKRYKGSALKHHFLGILTTFTLRWPPVFPINHISSDITSIWSYWVLVSSTFEKISKI